MQQFQRHHQHEDRVSSIFSLFNQRCMQEKDNMAPVYHPANSLLQRNLQACPSQPLFPVLSMNGPANRMVFPNVEPFQTSPSLFFSNLQLRQSLALQTVPHYALAAAAAAEEAAIVALMSEERRRRELFLTAFNAQRSSPDVLYPPLYGRPAVNPRGSVSSPQEDQMRSDCDLPVQFISDLDQGTASPRLLEEQDQKTPRQRERHSTEANGAVNREDDDDSESPSNDYHDSSNEEQSQDGSFTDDDDESEEATDVAQGLVMLHNQSSKTSSTAGNSKTKHVKGEQKEAKKASKANRVCTRGTSKMTVIWMKRYEELKLFKEEHGHTKVPFKYENTALAAWVQTQRKWKRLGRLSDEHINLLNLVGFQWSTKHENISKLLLEQYESYWMDRYSELEQFYKQHGHCMVGESHRKLRSWLYRQRKLSKENKIPEERLEMLRKLGFESKKGKQSTGDLDTK